MKTQTPEFYLFTPDAVHGLAKKPQEMFETLSIDALPDFYKIQYYQIVLHQHLSQLIDLGFVEGTRVSDEAIEGGFKLKDLMETYIIDKLGEDVVDVFKQTLEDAWNKQFNMDDFSQEHIDEADKLFNEMNITVVEPNLPTKMFP